MAEISLGLPVYNGEKYLRQSIDSILSQTFGDFSLFISDNCSTDATEEICRQYARQDPRITYLRHSENRGAAFNQNFVVSQAKAPFFKWVHSDDVHAPGHLERCIHELKKAPPSVAMVYSRTLIIDQDGAGLDPYEDRMDLRQDRPSERLKLAIRSLRMCNVLFGVYRTEVLQGSGLLEGYPSGDLPLIFEMSVRGQFWEVPEPLFYRRMHPETSHRKDRTIEEIAVWMDPSNQNRNVFHITRILSDTARRILQCNLPTVERWRCLACLFRYWGIPRGRKIGGEIKRAILHPPKKEVGSSANSPPLITSSPRNTPGTSAEVPADGTQSQPATSRR